MNSIIKQISNIKNFTAQFERKSALDESKAPSVASISQKKLIPNIRKNFEFCKEAAQIFCLERVTIAKGQGASEDEKFVVKPT